MTNTVVARDAAIERVKDHVREVTSGLPSGGSLTVFGHEPQAFYESRTAAVVNDEIADPTGLPNMTLGNMMWTHQYNIHVYWVWNNMDPGRLDDIEREARHVAVGILKALSADRDLGGNVTSLELTGARFGYITRGAGSESVIMRVLTIPFGFQELESDLVAL